MKTIKNLAVINISMPIRLLLELNDWVKQTEISRSEFIRRAIARYIEYLKRRKTW